MLEPIPLPSCEPEPAGWRPFEEGPEAYLDTVEGICRFTARLTDVRGAVIDPFLGYEHQYATPYFAFSVGTLLRAGRGEELLLAGTAAMEHATDCFSRGVDGIPHRHGEFFLASLPGALELYEPFVQRPIWERWRDRLRLPVHRIIAGLTNNWRTYAMRGEWLRAKLGLVERATAGAFIADSWLNAEQRDRIAGDRWNLYQDHQTDPESHAVEAVGRVNLLALVAAGYDGEFADEIAACAERGTQVSLLLQDPTGQCPPNGRADDHVFNDVLYSLAFEIMAGRTDDPAMAGRYRRAALLSHRGIQRWRRNDAGWEGSFFVTKNRFDPADRVGCQPASQYTNYNGAVMMHLAEAYLAAKSGIIQRPAPSECGGYAFATDEPFSTAVANAGGMQIFAALRGDTEEVYGRYWTALGVERFSRVGWDSRLGPSDGVRDLESGRGVSFGPTWKENGRWIRIAEVPDRYRGHFSVQEARRELVRCTIEYLPTAGNGPEFKHEFEITPDAVIATLTAQNGDGFGVTWPVLSHDGRDLQVTLREQTVSTSYASGGDEQRFTVLDEDANIVTEPPVLTSYGWVTPIRAEAVNGVARTLIKPSIGRVGNC